MARRWALLAVAGAGAVPAPEPPLVPLPVAARAAGCAAAEWGGARIFPKNIPVIFPLYEQQLHFVAKVAILVALIS